MAVFPLRFNQSNAQLPTGGIVSVGNFDGVHLGHAALIADARKLAGDRPVIAVTFDPHPLMLLAPERFQPPLTTISERARWLQHIGADHVVVLQTNPELLSLSPEAFFESIIRDSLQAAGMVEGFNFRFGHGRTGSNETLKALCTSAGMAFREVSAFELDGKPVSSSRVRNALEEGNIAAANRLLNRRYEIGGTVVGGAKRGRIIGFPTANLDQIATLLPAEGVYAVLAETEGGKFAAAANIGPNPTFGENARKIEVHLLDFSDDLYGQPLKIAFDRRLRGTVKFAGVEKLVEQLNRDVRDVRQAALLN